MNLENNYPIMRVKWIDSGAGHGWNSDLADICTIDSVGFLIEDSEDKVVLCESLGLTKGAEKYGCNTAIPRSQVKEMQLLSKPRNNAISDFSPNTAPPPETKESTGTDITRQFVYGPSYGLHSQ